VIDPVFGVVLLLFSRHWSSSREAIWAAMFLSRDMDKFEVKEEYGGDPPVYGSVGLHIGVLEHASYVAHVYLNYKVVSADQVEALHMEHMEEAV